MVKGLSPPTLANDYGVYGNLFKVQIVAYNPTTHAGAWCLVLLGARCMAVVHGAWCMALGLGAWPWCLALGLGA